MDKLIHSRRRSLLKAGIFYWPACAFPLSGYARPVPDADPFAHMRKHRWLSSYSSAPVQTSAAPPVIEHAPPPMRSPVLFWLVQNLELIKKYRLNPLRAARTLAYLTVSLHDAAQLSRAAFGDSASHCAIALNFSAARVLELLFPEETKGRWTGEAILLSSSSRNNADDWTALWKLAGEISQQVTTAALTDGSARTNALARPDKSITRAWIATPPLWSTRPVEPGAPGWRPWLVPPSVGEQCPPPLSLDEAAYMKEVELVYRTQKNLTSEQKQIAEAWNLDLGTVTPPGVWILKAINSDAYAALDMVEQTSLLSLMSTVMMDAMTACWHTKFKWWTERPVTVIRRLYDPAFLPHVLTPSFPSYTSGHATVSGAAATVLSALLPQHTDQWQAAAEEAANSRLYGGIHFKFDNSEGLALGRKVGRLAFASLAAAA